MPASTNPAVITGTLTSPPDEGVSPVPVQFGLQISYVSEVESRLIMTGAGTTTVPFGTVGAPGLKMLLIEYEADPLALPIQLKFNGGTDPLELAPGGFLAYGNPVPTTGITALTITRTGDAVVRVRLFG